MCNFVCSAEQEEEFYYTEVEISDLSSPAPAPLGPASASLPPSFTMSATPIQNMHHQYNQSLQPHQQQPHQLQLLPQQHHHHHQHAVSLSSSVNLSSMAFSPTLSHLDMVRPASEGKKTWTHTPNPNNNNLQINDLQEISSHCDIYGARKSIHFK